MATNPGSYSAGLCILQPRYEFHGIVAFDQLQFGIVEHLQFADSLGLFQYVASGRKIGPEQNLVRCNELAQGSNYARIGCACQVVIDQIQRILVKCAAYPLKQTSVMARVVSVPYSMLPGATP